MSAPLDSPTIDPVSIDLVQLDPDLPLPTYAHDGDAGLDLYAREDATLPAGGGRLLMPTGISIAIPVGYCRVRAASLGARAASTASAS